MRPQGRGSADEGRGAAPGGNDNVPHPPWAGSVFSVSPLNEDKENSLEDTREEGTGPLVTPHCLFFFFFLEEARC